jgi:hypothetical protein
MGHVSSHQHAIKTIADSSTEPVENEVGRPRVNAAALVPAAAVALRASVGSATALASVVHLASMAVADATLVQTPSLK